MDPETNSSPSYPSLTTSTQGNPVSTFPKPVLNPNPSLTPMEDAKFDSEEGEDKEDDYADEDEDDDEGDFEDLSTMDRVGNDLNTGSSPAMKNAKFPSQLEKDLFGEDDEDDAEDDEDLPVRGGVTRLDASDQEGEEEDLFGNEMDLDEEGNEESLDGSKDQETISQETYHPTTRVPEKDQVYLLDLPNLVRIDPKPFDPDLYEPMEATPDEVQLAVENTVRWRYIQTKDGGIEIQSNARVITWSDGSQSLLLGDEYLDLVPTAIPQNQYLVSIHHEDSMIIPERSFSEKILIKPYSTATKSHQRMASLLATKFRRQHKTKMVHLERDPEKVRAEQLKLEQEKIKAQKKLESKKKAIAARYARTSAQDDEDAMLDDEYEVNRSRLEEDDLDDFVVDDEEQVEHYTEEDELEEKRRMERLLSTRRESNRSRSALQPAEDSMLVDAEEEPDDEEESNTQLVRRNRALAVLSDDEEAD